MAEYGICGHLLDLALPRVGHAGEEVDEAAGDVLVGGLQVDDNGALLLEVVGNLAGVLKALGLDQHHLELGGGIDELETNGLYSFN